MKNQSGLVMLWYQEFAGFNFTVIHKKGKINSNVDALSRASHMEDAPLMEEDVYAEFYEVEEPVIKYREEVNEIQHIQQNWGEITEEQAKDEVWKEVISWVEKGKLPDTWEDEGGSRSLICIQPFSVQDKWWCADVH